MEPTQDTTLVTVDMTKPFDDLTHDELIALTEEQIQFFIDRSCAEEGVPLLPPSPPVEPEIEKVPKTIAHYCVPGLRFLDEADARSVADAARACKSRRCTTHLEPYRWDSPTHDAPEGAEITVSVEYVFDAPSAARQRAENESKGAKKAAYDEAKKAYDRASEGRRNVAASIRSAVSAAWRVESRRRELLSEYARYVPLANGDETVAKRFLQRAHGDAREVLPSLFPDGWNDEPATASVQAEEELI